MVSTMKKINLALFLTINFSFAALFTSKIHSAREIYQELNNQSPFVISFGTSMSQTHHNANTVHPYWMRERLQKLAFESGDPLKYLKNSQHLCYVMRALPDAICSKCSKTIQPTKLDLIKDKILISLLLHETATHKNATKLTLSICPECNGALIEQSQDPIILTPEHQQAMIEQIDFLGVKNQKSCTKFGLPTYRMSLEASDVLAQNSTEIDLEKAQLQAQFIQKMGNPLLFFHHYANPQIIPDLFEKSEHAAWFANYCAEIIKLSPNITHACPISQPVAFSHRVTRGTLPPFTCSISQREYLNNINNAQVLACKKMKEINPNLKVLMSHQWKPMKPYHSMLSPWYALETLICYIADRMYNGDFIRIFAPHQNNFDGIALSVYSALYFDRWTPKGSNCSGEFNEQDALEAIMSTHQAFPNKDIYIVETGCNTKDPVRKKEFIDMMLCVCKIARDRGVKIKGIYFWAHVNDPKFYSEWNLQPGSTNFSPFDSLNPEHPCDSINAGGLYLQEILKP